MSDCSAVDAELGLELVALESIPLVLGSVLAHRIVNRGSVSVRTGSADALDQRRHGRWESLHLGLSFRRMGVILDPGQHRDFTATLPTSLSTGTFRLRKTLTLGRTPRAQLPLPETAHRLPVQLAVEFDVKGE